MTVIEIPDHQAAALTARAAAEGLTLTAWLAQLAGDAPGEVPRRPLKTGRGLLASYGTAPSAETIEENRRDMFQRFAED